MPPASMPLPQLRGALPLRCQKFGNPSSSTSTPGAKKVVLVPSGATIPGLSRTKGGLIDPPEVSKRIGVDPAEENDSSTGGAVPKAGVSP